MKRAMLILIIISISLILLGALVMLLALVGANWNFRLIFAGETESFAYTVSEDFSDITVNGDTPDVRFLPSENGERRVDIVRRKNGYEYSSFGSG